MTIVAIDGPAGSGKSTIARLVSKFLDFEYVDSGAIYRTMTFFGMESFQGICSGHEQEIADHLLSQPNQIGITYQEHNQVMWLSGENVSQAIRDPEVTKQVRFIADNPDCRAFVNRVMRDIARRFSVVIDGRDIGTKVFPKADYKFYLDAKAEIRAIRRARELNIPLEGKDCDSLLQDIERRDQQDKERSIAPLQPADDAVRVDTSDLTVKEVVRVVLDNIGRETVVDEI